MKSLNTSIKPRRNYWLIIEKIIGFLLLCWSTFVLYTVISNISNMYSSGYVTAQNITVASIAVKNHFIIIVSTLCMFGSCMLLYNDKNGWFLCMVTSLIFGINSFMSSRSKALNSKLAFAEYYKSYGLVAILFFIIFILLLLKPIRSRYQPTAKTWAFLGLTILLLIIDRMAF